MKHLIFHLLLWIFMLIVAATFSSCNQGSNQTDILNEERLTDTSKNIGQELYCPDHFSS